MTTSTVCPQCGSSDVLDEQGSYFAAFECRRCGYRGGFTATPAVKDPKAATNEPRFVVVARWSDAGGASSRELSAVRHLGLLTGPLAQVHQQTRGPQTQLFIGWREQVMELMSQLSAAGVAADTKEITGGKGTDPGAGSATS